jgi:hypothetical protein
MTNNTITRFETSHVGPDFDDFTGDVLAEDGRVVERVPGFGLETAVNGVDCDGVVLDEDFFCGGCPEGGFFDFKRVRFGLEDPGSGVERHCVMS